jgi:hypothetical protein
MADDDYRERFAEQVSASYGQMETLLGTDAYAVFLEDHRADQQRILADADRRKAMAALLRITAFIGILFALPVMVYLWKWALSA